MEDVIGYIYTKGYEYKDAGSQIALKYCPYCEQPDKGNYSHFYFDKETAVFYCHKCQSKGNLFKFKMDMGDIVIGKAKDKFYVKPKELKLDNSIYQEYESRRGIKQEILDKYKVGQITDNKLGKCIVYSYFNEKNEIFNYKYRNKNKEMRIEKGAEINYYGLQYIDYEKNYLNITEGEDDCHALVQYGFDNVVSLPMGINNYSISMEMINKKFDRLNLYFDMDEAGQRGAKIFSEKAGLWKCFNYKLQYKDARECLLKGITRQEIDNIVPDQFKHQNIIKAGDLKEDLLSYMTNKNEFNGIYLNDTKGLMNILEGIRMGELTILTGDTGSGKSTYAYNMASWLCNAGYKSMVLSFENKLVQVLAKMIMIITKENINNKNDEWKASIIDFLNEQELYFLKEHGYFPLENMKTVIEYARKYFNIQFFVIDHLHYFLHIRRDERLELDHAIREIKGWCNDYNIHILLIIHPHATAKGEKVGINNLKGASSLKQECDNFLSIHRLANTEFYLTDNSKKTSEIIVEKNRAKGTVGKVEYYVLPNNNTFTEEL